MTEIILQTYNVLDEIKEKFHFKKLSQLKATIDKTYEEEIKQFNQAKKEYDEIMEQGGMFHQRYQEVAKNLSLAKEMLYNKNEVKDYMTIEKNIQFELNDLLNSIAKTISKEIQTPNEFGIISKKGKHHVHK
jgi:cell fate (sporulation/competence/biofilm development) regulator YlbF (YheA/YmcA/DUF963 family)